MFKIFNRLRHIRYPEINNLKLDLVKLNFKNILLDLNRKLKKLFQTVKFHKFMYFKKKRKNMYFEIVFM